MILQALQAIAVARSRPSVRLLDAIYGPQAKALRAQVVDLMLDGQRVQGATRAKMTQYGNLRRALVESTGAKGDCTAVENARFEELADHLLRGTSPIPADFRTAIPPPHDAQALRDLFGV